ncbi:hypothetical protein [Streptomyces aureocirculatus]|uniref:hypothetical protein n=1 Tax=Streptomyces aureocirculatus TaxID=67275 RepID=UPI0004CA9BBA
MHIQVVLFDGVDPLDAIAPYEVLYAGGSVTDRAVTVELVTAEGPREVVSGTGGPTLRAVGAHAVRARIVDDGDLITGTGVTSGLDLGPYPTGARGGPHS